MTGRLGAGLVLPPETGTLELLRGAIEEADYYEVAPETLWRVGSDGAFVPNGFHARFLELKERTGKPFVAHGVGLSLGSEAGSRFGGDEGGAARRQRWLTRIAADRRAFEFAWYSDHLGSTSVAGDELALPLPLPMTEAAAARVRAGLASLARITSAAAVENSTFYFHVGDPLGEPAFLERCTAGPGLHLLLDLHNVFTTAENAGLDPLEYVDRLPLERVIEIHVSGGKPSDPRSMPSSRPVRLDSHDTAVPEEVWDLVELVVPRCPGLRGVTVERMEGTIADEADAERVREEVARARELLARCGTGERPDGAERASAPDRPPLAEGDEAELDHYEAFLAAWMRSRDPLASRDGLARDHALPDAMRARLTAADEDGVRITAWIVARLRFERLIQGSPEAIAAFDADPREFARTFRAYHLEVAPRAVLPSEEARAYRAWLEARGVDPAGVGAPGPR